MAFKKRSWVRIPLSPLKVSRRRERESLWLKLYRDGMLGRNQGQIMKGISSTTRMYLFIYVYTDS